MGIKELVVCKFAGCNQVLNDARFLPCGKRTCAAHIETMVIKSDDMSSANRQMIKCHFCEEIHSFPENGKGFPVDEHILELLSMSYSIEHDAAKKSFNKVRQLLDKLVKLDNEDYVIDYFERVEADIVLEKEVNMQKLVAHYQKLVDDLHERKVQCLHNLKTQKIESDAIKQTLIEHRSKLKKESLDTILMTLDGDDHKWKEIQLECNILLTKVQLLEEELNERIVGIHTTGFRPSSSKTRIEDIFGALDQRLICSTIVTSFKMENDLVELGKLGGKKFKLIYRATRDGFRTSIFHAKCDNIPNTLTIIKSTNGCIFGGYTSVAWDSTSGFKADPTAFIFSLVNFSSAPQPSLIRAKFGNKHSIYCDASRGITFGNGHDISICSHSNTTNESFAFLGSSYDFKLFDCGTAKAQSYLAGTCHFLTAEIEIFTCN